MKNATPTLAPCYAYIYSVDGDVAKLVLGHSRQYSSISSARRAMRTKSRRFGNGYMFIVDTKSLAHELKKEILQNRINSSLGF